AVAELKFVFGVKLITPEAVMFTVPLLTVMVWVVPVKAVPLIDVMLKVSPSTSVSSAKGLNYTHQTLQTNS
ncbi:hypothetical protein, partial [Flavobacterium chungangense]